MYSSCLVGKKIYKYRVHVLKFNGVWIVLLLVYSHTLHTAMSIVYCPEVPGIGNVSALPKSICSVSVIQRCGMLVVHIIVFMALTLILGS